MDGMTPKLKKKSVGKRIFWAVVFVVLAVLTVWTVTSRSKDFSWERLREILRTANPFWMGAAVLAMAGFVVFEALSLRVLEGFFGHRRNLFRNTLYVAGDIYFSGITPSATGGQPAAAMLMMRDGIPGAITAMCLLLNVIAYTISIVVIGAICLIFFPGIYLSFSLFYRILIWLGMIAQSMVIVFLALLVFRDKIIFSVAEWAMRLLHKLHLMKNIETHREKLRRTAAEYSACAKALHGHSGVFLKALLFNFGQRFCNTVIPVFICFAVGADFSMFPKLLIAQCYVVLGSNAVPIPGAVGVADGLFLNVFSNLIEDTACIELVSRSMSFYLLLVICALMFFGAILFRSAKNRSVGKKTGEAASDANSAANSAADSAANSAADSAANSDAENASENPADPPADPE